VCGVTLSLHGAEDIRQNQLSLQRYAPWHDKLPGTTKTWRTRIETRNGIRKVDAGLRPELRHELINLSKNQIYNLVIPTTKRKPKKNEKNVYSVRVQMVIVISLECNEITLQLPVLSYV